MVPKIDFEKIILTKTEKHDIAMLKKHKCRHMDTITSFDSLNRCGFLCLAHPESITPDGYGGYFTDDIYCLSETYELYDKYLRKKKTDFIFQRIGDIKNILKK